MNELNSCYPFVSFCSLIIFPNSFINYRCIPDFPSQIVFPQHLQFTGSGHCHSLWFVLRVDLPLLKLMEAWGFCCRKLKSEVMNTALIIDSSISSEVAGSHEAVTWVIELYFSTWICVTFTTGDFFGCHSLHPKFTRPCSTPLVMSCSYVEDVYLECLWMLVIWHLQSARMSRLSSSGSRPNLAESSLLMKVGQLWPIPLADILTPG